LALKQAEEIQQHVGGVTFDIVPIATRGDKDKKTPLDTQEGNDFFTDEIERALQTGAIDAAIHSAKDLEDEGPRDLVVAAVTATISPFDCLVSRQRETLDTLSAQSRVGTSSRRRRQALLSYRSDLLAKDIRGNIDERLAQLDQGDFEAVIIAHAALVRLGLSERSRQILPFEIIQPHPLQGRLAVQIRKDRDDLYRFFGELNEQ